MQHTVLSVLCLKGSLNEYELDLLRQRSVEARREKARRGELIVSAPIGYVKCEDQRLEKDPDLRIQQRSRSAVRLLQSVCRPHSECLDAAP
jgi:DNA invertase Pin-like site-specific DNA recombinase